MTQHRPIALPRRHFWQGRRRGYFASIDRRFAALLVLAYLLFAFNQRFSALLQAVSLRKLGLVFA